MNKMLREMVTLEEYAVIYLLCKGLVPFEIALQYKLEIQGLLVQIVSKTGYSRSNLKKRFLKELSISTRLPQELVGEELVVNERQEVIFDVEAVDARQHKSLKFTPKEKVIIGFIVQGYKNKAIAKEIHSTEQVIKNYLRAIYDKTGVNDRLELALYVLGKTTASREQSHEVETPAEDTIRMHSIGTSTSAVQ